MVNNKWRLSETSRKRKMWRIHFGRLEPTILAFLLAKMWDPIFEAKGELLEFGKALFFSSTSPSVLAQLSTFCRIGFDFHQRPLETIFFSASILGPTLGFRFLFGAPSFLRSKSKQNGVSLFEIRAVYPFRHYAGFKFRLIAAASKRYQVYRKFLIRLNPNHANCVKPGCDFRSTSDFNLGCEMDALIFVKCGMHKVVLRDAGLLDADIEDTESP